MAWACFDARLKLLVADWSKPRSSFDRTVCYPPPFRLSLRVVRVSGTARWNHEYFSQSATEREKNFFERTEAKPRVTTTDRGKIPTTCSHQPPVLSTGLKLPFWFLHSGLFRPAKPPRTPSTRLRVWESKIWNFFSEITARPLCLFALCGGDAAHIGNTGLKRRQKNVNHQAKGLYLSLFSFKKLLFY